MKFMYCSVLIISALCAILTQPNIFNKVELDLDRNKIILYKIQLDQLLSMHKNLALSRKTFPTRNVKSRLIVWSAEPATLITKNQLIYHVAYGQLPFT